MYILIHNYFPGDTPSLPELLRLNVHTVVGAKCVDFGIIILNDTSSEIDKIKEAHQTDAERVRIILEEWINLKKGLPVTWENLIRTLRECGMWGLAQSIEDKKIVGM